MLKINYSNKDVASIEKDCLGHTAIVAALYDAGLLSGVNLNNATNRIVEATETISLARYGCCQSCVRNAK